MLNRPVAPEESAPVLIASPNCSICTRLKESLRQLGFERVHASSSHREALERAEQEPFSHVFFDGEETDLPPVAFVEKMCVTQNDLSLIGVSDELQVDHVFELLRAGARGFLVPPFSADSVERSIRYAEQEGRLKQDLLKTEDRGSTMAEVLINNFNLFSRLQAVLRDAPANRELLQLVKARRSELRSLARPARSAVPGGEAELVQYIVERCIKDSRGAETRLGKLRDQLHKQRSRR